MRTITVAAATIVNGPFGFVMAEAKAYPRLIPYRGQLGIFGVPDSVLQGVA